MKKFILSIVLLVVLLSANGESVNAQKEIRLSSTPQAFQTFYAKFRNAVIEGDKKTVVSLTHFPFSYEYVEEGDRGTYSKAKFIEKIDVLLNRKRKILTQKNPVFSSNAGDYNLNDNSDATVFTFGKKGKTYKLTAFLALP
jgi:hypothetical protein